MSRTVRVKLGALAAALALVGAACSSDDPAASGGVAPATTATTATEAPTTAAPTTAAPTTAPPTTATPTTAVAAPPAVELPPLPSQPAGIPFPTEQWPEAELPADVDGAALQELLDRAFDAEQAPYGNIEGAVVIVGGELVAERYGRGHEADEVHVSWSVAKSVTHALLGVLEGEDRLDVYAPAAIAEWSDPDDPRAEITPDVLARMSSGLAWNEPSDAVATVSGASTTPAAERQVNRSLSADIDTVFNYSTGSTAINGRVIGDLVGTGGDFEAWADGVLFAPLGIETVELEMDADGYWAAGWGANMTARDFARFGLLYLRDGVWDGTRILPDGWVDYARTPSPTSNGYGAGFWLGFYGDGVFSAEGFLGQKVIIDPESDAVIVVLANNFSEQPTGEFAGALTELFRAS